MTEAKDPLKGYRGRARARLQAWNARVWGDVRATNDAGTCSVMQAGRQGQTATLLPDGNVLIAGGEQISGGQRQRVALARAIVTNPRILVLDDATSAVDTTTEEAIHAELRSVMAGRTTILVAHRASTVRLADRVVLMEDGRVIDEGTHDDLLSRRADYRALMGDEAEGSVVADEPVGPNGITASAWPYRPSDSARAMIRDASLYRRSRV